MGGNTFYSNAEAYALEILQQRLLSEAQRSAQQTIMELSALKALFNQGQFFYCIPLGLGSPSPPFPLPCPLSLPSPALCPPNQLHPAPIAPPPPLPQNHQSTVHLNMKPPHSKVVTFKPSSEDCTLGDVGIEMSVDLREYLPAEISIDVEEKAVEVKACHVDAQGRRTFSRRYDLPACIILDSVKCVLSHDGYLLLSAAWLKME